MPFAGFEDFDACVGSVSPKKNPKTGKPYGAETARKICGKLQSRHEKKKSIEYKSFNIAFPMEFKDTFFEAIMSSPRLDLGNDIVTAECIADMVRQVQMNASTLKGSLYHDAVLEHDANLLPISRLESAEMLQDGKIKFIGKFNEHHPDFNNLAPMFKDKFLDGISIEYVPKKYKTVEKDGQSVRMLDKIDLIGYGHVPRPMNPDAAIIDVFSKSLENLMEQSNELDKFETEIMSLIDGSNSKVGPQMEAKNMESKTAETKQDDESPAPEGEASSEPASETPSTEGGEEKAVAEEVKQLKVELEKARKELEEVKARASDSKITEEVKTIVEAKIKELQPQSKVLIPSNEEVSEKLKNVEFSDVIAAKFGG